MKTKLLTIISAFVLAGPIAAHAALIASYGTGSSGTVTGGTLTTDNLWIYDYNNQAYFQGATTPASNWVWGVDPTQDATINFTFSFDLTGYDLSTVSLSGIWGADNYGSVSLNGNVVSALPETIPRYTNYRTLTSYSTNEATYFNQGLNHLVYSATNVGGPGGFRAAGEVFGDLAPPTPANAPVPAPASLLLVLAGLAGLGARRKRLSA